MSDSAEDRSGAVLVGGGLVLAVIALILANTDLSEEDGGGFDAALFSIIVVLAAIAAVIYVVALRRAGTDATAVWGLVVAILAVIAAVMAYWSGLPFLLGAAAIAMGRHAPSPGRLRLAVQTLGVFAIVVAAVVLISDLVA